MADDFDVEAMLEAPYRKEDPESRGKDDRDEKSRDKDRDRDRDRRKRSKSRDRERRSDKGRDKDRDRRDDRDRDRKRRSRSRDKDRRKDDRKDRDRRRSRSRERKRRSRSPFRGGRGGGIGGGGFGGGPRRRSFSRSPLRVTLKNPEPEMTPEERDARTVFCMQLSARIRPRDLEEFFSAVGKVKDVRIITDNKTRRSKGIAYIEFYEVESVPLAMGLTGQRLLGVPIIVQASQAEKNRLANAAMMIPKTDNTGPMRLYVGSLHFNITEDMLRGIFEPFGKIDEIKLMRNHETGTSQGYGFITFHSADDAKKALEQLNGFELAGRPMKVGHVTERAADATGQAMLDSDEMDRSGIDLGATGRLQLMAKLAEGTGFELPSAAANALNMAPGPQQGAAAQQQQQGAPPIATQCFMLSNMFDPVNETSPTWEVEIKDDVIEECNKHGGVLHIYVDKASPQGNVYVKCPTISAAVASVQALHGRWFAGKMITAAYVPLPNYHSLFPDALRVQNLMAPSSMAPPPGMPPGMPMPPMPPMGMPMPGPGMPPLPPGF